MKVLYECETCHKQFGIKSSCALCELSHLCDDDEKYKYYVLHIMNHDICAVCKHAYYVYGCELNCAYKDCNSTNNYKDFKRVED